MSSAPGPVPMPPAWTTRWSHDPRRKSPTLAVILSCILPGVGHVYLGYYQRAFVHAMVFAGTIACLSSGAAHGLEPLFGIFLGFFWFYTMIDAGRRASLYNQALAGMTQIPVQMPEDFKLPSGGGSIFGGVVITLIGLLLFLNTRFDFDLEWLADWWPMLIVAGGVYMTWKAMRDRARS